MKKRFLAMLMAVVMLIGIIPTGVIAQETDAPAEITYGSYNEEGTWEPTGESSVTENGITLSKNAVRKSENTYEVTLRVETSTTTSTVAASAATVLVIDVSGSMDYCADCKTTTGFWGGAYHSEGCKHYNQRDNEVTYAQSRMAAAKTAAISFLNSYCDAPADSGRYVSVVKFSDNGSVAQDWIDVSGGKDGNANYNTVVGVINGLSANGGTNLDDGLYDANAQFNESEVSGIKNKFTIALTDGVPTYARGNIGDGSNGSEAIISATTGTAATLRGNSKVYTVCFGVANDYTYETWGGSKGPTVGNFLANSVATSGCAYNADNASELFAAFAAITEDITSGLALSGSNVTDPMGGVVGTLEVSNVDKMTDGLGFTWTLGDAEITDSVDEAGNRVKTYVYTKTYTVTLNDSVVKNHNGYYPLNNSTTLTLEDGTVLQFPIPAVSPRYTVIYDNGDYGTLTDENADGQIVYNRLRYEDTPEEPTVNPDADHYHIGWSPVVADKVTESVTYVAQYAPKTAVTITGDSATRTYNGSEQSVDTFKVEGLPQGYTLEGVKYVAKGTDVGTYTGSFDGTDILVLDENKKPVTEQFTVTLKPGELKVEPRQVILTSATDSKTYDGTALTNDTVTVSGDGFVEGEGAAYSEFASILDLGKVDNTFTYTLNSNTKAANYTIEVKYGTLEIIPNPSPITITADSNAKVYDGTALTDNGYTFTQGILKNGDVLTAVVEGTITDVGDAANVVTSYKVMRGETDVTANYTFAESVNGKLTVTKRPVTLTSATDSKTYDGTALANETVTVTGDGFAEGEGATYNVTGSQTVAGSSKNTFTYSLNEGTKADNYNITTVEGTLTVFSVEKEVVVTITEHSGNYTYDGTEKTVTGYTVSIDNELYTENDFTFSGDATVKGTDAGTYQMELTPENFVNINENFENVTFVIVDGTLEIAKRTVTLTSGTATKQYDRTALTKEEVTVSGDGFAEGEGATYSNFASIFDVGEVDNEFTYTLDESTKADNYVIEQKFGLLVVTKAGEVKVIITENSGEYTYDGTEKSVEGYTVALPENAPYTEEDFEFEGEALVTGTYVGEYDMELTPENFININENFENVTFVIVDGTLVIKPIETAIDITADSNEKIYDGTALTDDGYTFTENVLVKGDELVVVVEGTITDAGTVENKIVSYQVLRTAVEQRATVDVTDCYTFGEITDGTLTVKPREVVITSGSDTKVYDGTPLTNCDIAAEGFVKGEGAMVTFTGSQLNAGISENTFTFVFAENTKAQNYTVIVVNGKLEVTPKAVTITSGSANKHYDGEPLTCDQITAEGFVEGEGAEYDITGSQTEVGTGKNTFTYKMKDNTLAENYTVTLVEGDLLVLPPIEIPNTGDNTNLVLYAGMMVASAAAFVTLLVAGKKKGKYAA